ncbi:hypothetical protein RhiirB3_469749 [Rhizophagus irregularis]|nr:hypothetical protein RhiirB3_469749 [Rhizophagus irregularis]
MTDEVFSLLDLLLGPFSLRLPLGLSSLRQVFSLLGLLLGSFSLRLIPLGTCVGWECVSWECVGWECGLGVWVGSVVYLLSTKVFSLSLRSFSLRFPLGLSILCQGCLFIRPSLRSSFYRYVYLLSVKVFSLLGFLLDPFSLRLHLGVWVGSESGLGECGSVGLESVGWECVGWECGFGWVCVWVGSVGWECGLGVWVGSVGLSSLCLIGMYDFVVAVIETPVPLKNARNQVQIRVT